MKKSFQPKIAAFLCNWCSHAGEETGKAGLNRVNLIKVPCLGNLDPVFILKAFESGADCVMVSGCHPDKCTYKAGNLLARRRWMVLKNMLAFAGIEPGRIHFSWVSAAENIKLIDLIKQVTAQAKRLGPLKRL